MVLSWNPLGLWNTPKIPWDFGHKSKNKIIFSGIKTSVFFVVKLLFIIYFSRNIYWIIPIIYNYGNNSKIYRDYGTVLKSLEIMKPSRNPLRLWYCPKILRDYETLPKSLEIMEINFWLVEGLKLQLETHLLKYLLKS